MTKYELNNLCMDDIDLMINAEVRCKHDIYCKCRRLDQIVIPVEDFGRVLIIRIRIASILDGEIWNEQTKDQNLFF
ncbi:hypothetical protein P3S68_024557 [Capsicum galapagoense]